MGCTESLKSAQRFLTSHRTQSRTELPTWARPSEGGVHLRRAGRSWQLGWFGSSEISTPHPCGSATDTQAVDTGVPLATHQAVGAKGSRAPAPSLHTSQGWTAEGGTRPLKPELPWGSGKGWKDDPLWLNPTPELPQPSAPLP